MKPSLRFLAFALGTGLAFAAPTAAHAQVSVGVQIGTPAWGPPVQPGTQYYYIPEIDGYYDIYNQLYLVFDGQQWISLPYIDGYDPYYFHPYPVSYVGAQPWLYINSYRRYYPQYVSGWHRGGWGGAGRYYGQDYGAGRVYGYGGRPGGYDGRGYYGNRPGFDNRGNNGGFGRPGYNNFPDRRDGDRDRFDRRDGNFSGDRDRRDGNFPGGPDRRTGQPGGNFGGGQPQRGGFPSGGQPGGFQGGNRDGGRPGGFQGGQPGGQPQGGFPGGGNREGGRREGR